MSVDKSIAWFGKIATTACTGMVETGRLREHGGLTSVVPRPGVLVTPPGHKSTPIIAYFPLPVSPI